MTDQSNRPILRRGASGPAVFALREHLRQLGHKFGSERDFGDRTEVALIDFQTQRGLRADGICGPQTWAALHEAGWALGDRIIALRRPNLRGDDVTSLQHRLSALGFDPGRPDGIFGPRSESALREFQRNAGIASDGVCGPATITALDRLDALAAGSVAEVREHETLAGLARTALHRRVTLVGSHAVHDLVLAIAERLCTFGVDVDIIDEPGVAAAHANSHDVDLVVALVEPESGSEVMLTYFGNVRFRSIGGFTHASRIVEELERCGVAAELCARTSALLRETRMAAVGVHLSPGRTEATDVAVAAIAVGIRRGFDAAPVQP